MSDMAERNVEVVRRWFDALRKGGSDAALRTYDESAAPRFEWRGGPAGRDMVGGDVVYRGREGLKRFYDEIDRVVSWWRFGEPEFKPYGERVVRVNAHLKLSWRESEVELEQDMAYVFELEDGKIVGGEAFRSAAEADAHARERAEERVDA